VIRVPDRGTFVDESALGNLVRLKMSETEPSAEISLPRGMIVH
jgi:hypothetical protein